RPGELDGSELVAALQRVDERRYLRSVVLRPVRLGQQVVDDVNPARSQQRERVIEMRELARPCISVDQIELSAWQALNEVGAIRDVERNSPIGSEMTSGDRDDARVSIDRVEM